MHIDHYGTAAEQARRRLAHLDPIGESDDEDDSTVKTEDGLRIDESGASSAASDTSEELVSRLDPYCEVPLDCPGYECSLRVSVVGCLLKAWTKTRDAARRWIDARDRGLWRLCDGEAALRVWLQQPADAVICGGPEGSTVARTAPRPPPTSLQCECCLPDL